jgi:hypothetical protein
MIQLIAVHVLLAHSRYVGSEMLVKRLFSHIRRSCFLFEKKTTKYQKWQRLASYPGEYRIYPGQKTAPTNSAANSPASTSSVQCARSTITRTICKTASSVPTRVNASMPRTAIWMAP